MLAACVLRACGQTECGAADYLESRPTFVEIYFIQVEGTQTRIGCGLKCDITLFSRHIQCYNKLQAFYLARNSIMQEPHARSELFMCSLIKSKGVLARVNYFPYLCSYVEGKACAVLHCVDSETHTITFTFLMLCIWTHKSVYYIVHETLL